MAALPYCPKMGLSVIGAIFHPPMALRLPTNHKEAVFQCDDRPKKSYLAKINDSYFLSDPSGTDLSLVFSTSSSSSSSPSRPVSDYYYKCLIYHIQA